MQLNKILITVVALLLPSISLAQNLEDLRKAFHACQHHAVCEKPVSGEMAALQTQRCQKDPTAWDDDYFRSSCPNIVVKWRKAEAEANVGPPSIPQLDEADKQFIEKSK